MTSDLAARARTVLPGGNTRTTVYVPPAAPYAAAGSGCVLTDADGHRLIDCNNNYTALVHGHAHPNIVAAASAVIATGTAFGLPTRWEVLLGETLRRRLPGMDLWRFANSGTEAVMMAVRLARAATGRDLVLRFKGSYHGTYDDVVDADRPGITGASASTTVVVPVDDAAAFTEAMDACGDRLACVLIDLMPNRAGLRPVSEPFARLVRARTREAGALLVVDEVITFRLASGGLQQRYGIAPDVTVLGKIIGGGFPVGAVGGRAEVMEVFDPGRQSSVSWGGTFSANPVSMAAGAAALDLYDAEAIERLNAAGDALRTRLTDAGLTAAGLGSLLRVFPTAEQWWELYRRRVLVSTNGLIAVSTAMTDRDVRTVEHALTDVLADGAGATS